MFDVNSEAINYEHIERIPYSAYKKSYSDCKKIIDSYDSETKTIEVIIPKGRMKHSVSRGKNYFCNSYVTVTDENGKEFQIYVKALDKEHLIKRLSDNKLKLNEDY